MIDETPKIEETFVANLVFVNCNENVDLNSFLRSENRSIFNLNERVWDIIVLPNSMFLMVNLNGKNITMLDKDLKVIQVIDNIDGYFQPFGVAIGDNYKVYVSDIMNNRLIMTNMAFERSLAVNAGKFYGLCYKNSLLYACEMQEKKIKIFDKDFNIFEMHNVNYFPWFIKVTESRICVQAYTQADCLSTKQILESFDGKYFNNVHTDNNLLYFYDTRTFTLLNTYNHGVGRISQIGLKFYELDDDKKIIYCYDEKGILKNELVINKHLHNWKNNVAFYGCLAMADRYLCVTGEKNLFKFSDY
jgi:hypothetical protein